MAYFAKLGLDNIVLQVHTIDNINCMSVDGIENEEIGIKYLTDIHGHQTWKQCSYNTHHGIHKYGGIPLRANYPDKGWYYSSEYDIFYPPKPYESWNLNTSTGEWEPPIPRPIITEEQQKVGGSYKWDEGQYQMDNTSGWIYVSNIK